MKQTNLRDFLFDLYQGIASKKPDASRNPQDFRAEIESIKAGVETWDRSFTVIGTSTGGEGGGGGGSFPAVIPSVKIVQPSKYFLDDITITASFAVSAIQNLTVTKGA